MQHATQKQRQAKRYILFQVNKTDLNLTIHKMQQIQHQANSRNNPSPQDGYNLSLAYSDKIEHNQVEYDDYNLS